MCVQAVQAARLSRMSRTDLCFRWLLLMVFQVPMQACGLPDLRDVCLGPSGRSGPASACAIIVPPADISQEVCLKLMEPLWVILVASPVFVRLGAPNVFLYLNVRANAVTAMVQASWRRACWLDVQHVADECACSSPSSPLVPALTP